MLRGALCGHTDSVWGLVYSSAHQRLLSCSADGTVRLWDAADTSPALAIFNEDTGNSANFKSHPHSHVQNSSLITLQIYILILIRSQCVLCLCNTSLRHSHCSTQSCPINDTSIMHPHSRKHSLCPINDASIKLSRCRTHASCCINTLIKPRHSRTCSFCFFNHTLLKCCHTTGCLHTQGKLTLFSKM